MTEQQNNGWRELRTWRRVKVSLVRERADQPYTMRQGSDVVGLVREFVGSDPREQFLAVYLDARHRPIAVHAVAMGGLTSCPVDPRAVFGPALQLGAVALVVAHNHPSGDPTPSVDDRTLTDRLRQAGELLGVALLDHIVIGGERFHSFADGSTHYYARAEK